MECRRGLALWILSDRPSVCLSNACIVTKRKKKSVQWFLHLTKGGATLSTWNFGSTGPRWSEIAYFEQIIARSASAVTPSEKSLINTNRKSATRFPMSQRWSSYVAPKSPKGGSKRKTTVLPLKSYFALRKSRGGFRHVQHVRPNRGPHKKGLPTRGLANFCNIATCRK